MSAAPPRPDSAGVGAPRRLVALVDCSAFYCSCERAFRPDLAGRPVVVLSNNDGCVIARTAEAKALGVEMGAPYFKARRRLERAGAAVFSSNYALYADLSRRVMETLERFSPDVERSSIDEAFLALPADRSRPEAERERLAALADDVRRAVLGATGIPVRVSVAETKTLAKAASEYVRAAGGAGEGGPQTGGLQTGGAVCFWGHPDRDAFLDALPVEAVWGIGPRWSRRLRSEGVRTAAAFAALDDRRLRRHYTVVALRTAWELRGVPCVAAEGAAPRRSLVRSRSFGARTARLDLALEAVATHAARAAEKLRAEGLVAGALQVFLTTGGHGPGPHRQGSAMAPLAPPTASPFRVVGLARRLLRACHVAEDRVGRPVRYLKAGVVLTELAPAGPAQADLFEAPPPERPELLAAVDRINARFGRHAVAVAAQGPPATLARMAAGGAGGPAWAMRRERMSPRYTTAWDDLPTVRLLA